MPELPPGFRRRAAADRVVAVDAALEAAAEAAGLLEGPGLEAALAGGAGARGRGATAELALPGRPERLVLRRLLHGGLLGPLLGGAWLGARRPLAELAATARLHAAGAPVPRPALAAAWRRRSPLFAAAFATVRVPEARDALALLEELGELEERTARARVLGAAAAVGEALRRFHDAGGRHADLHVKNLLLREGEGATECWVIDLDRARAGEPPGPARRAAEIARLQRSLVKRGVAARVGPRGAARFLAAYCGGDRPLRRALLRRLRPRIRLGALHRAGYRARRALRGAAALGLAAALALPGAAAAEEAERATPAVVVGPHDRALVHWLRAAGAGRLPESGATVLHFDAHPDLAVPRRPLSRALRGAPERAAAAVDIDTFQLAAAWLGLVERVVWLRPAWARQIPDGERTFRLGRTAQGALAVDDPSDYYVLDEEGGFAPTDSLHDAVSVELEVVPLAAAAERLEGPRGPWILDVDLDGFATRNPAAERLRAAGLDDATLDRLRAIFRPEALALAEAPEARRRDLERLESALLAAARGSGWERVRSLYDLWWLGVGPLELWDLDGILRGPAARVGTERLLRDGRMLVGLPEQRSASPEAVARTAERIARVAAAAREPPRLVTVARSVRDGFTPAEVARRAEPELLRALERALGPLARAP